MVDILKKRAGFMQGICKSMARYLVIMLVPVFLIAAGACAESHGAADNSAERSVMAEKNMQKFLGGAESPLLSTDPDFVAIRDRLIYGDIAQAGTLSDKQRELITLVVLATIQTLDDIKTHVNAALSVGLTPVEIKEAIYQCAPYIGFPKTEAALKRVNEALAARNISLPLESQSTVTESSRYADGLSVQKSIFGDVIDTMHKTAPAGQLPIVQNYLSAFCFGDIYTRKGLDLATRELLTFSIISALGGCESQVRSHVQANVAVGNSKQNLVDALAQSLPCIGFPRTLNALACINAVIPEAGQAQ